MPAIAFWLVFGLLVAANLAYPAWQAHATGGVVYYTNANDEYVYLLYNYARAVASPTRPGEYLVVWGHRLGLSGGWQNLLADLFVPLAFGLGLLAVFRRLGWEGRRARLATLAMLGVPLLFSTLDPIFKSLSFRNIATSWIIWINMVDQPASALLRTPEPQTSWLILLAGALLGLRWRSVLPLLALTPFTYTFVGLPTAFVAGAWWLHRRWGDHPARVAGPLLLAWLGLGLAAGAYHHFLASERLKWYLVPTHLPLLSVTACFALAAYAMVRGAIAPAWRFAALACALAPLAASNLQLVSGFVAQPSNYEQHFGIFAVAFVLVLGAGAWPRAYPLVVAAGCALWLSSAAADFQRNAATNGRLPFDAGLAAALREDSHHVAVNNRDLASVLGLVYPRQETTALGYDQGNVSVADRYIGAYRCARRRIRRDFPRDGGFFEALLQLDHLFLTGNRDYAIISIYRPMQRVVLYGVEDGCEPGEDHPLRYFLVRPR